MTQYPEPPERRELREALADPDQVIILNASGEYLGSRRLTIAELHAPSDWTGVPLHPITATQEDTMTEQPHVQRFAPVSELAEADGIVIERRDPDRWQGPLCDAVDRAIDDEEAVYLVEDGRRVAVIAPYPG